jgi:hypothetical protein
MSRSPAEPPRFSEKRDATDPIERLAGSLIRKLREPVRAAPTSWLVGARPRRSRSTVVARWVLLASLTATLVVGGVVTARQVAARRTAIAPPGLPPAGAASSPADPGPSGTNGPARASSLP